MTDLMLLPTARLVAPELQGEFGEIPPALVPLEGLAAYRHIGHNTLDFGGQLVLAAHDGIALLSEEVSRAKQDRVRVVDVGATTSLGETILQALQVINVEEHRLVINFADTYVGDLPNAGDVICFRKQEDTQRWTTFTSTDGAIDAIVDKDIEKTGEELSVFVGVFAFTNAHLFKELLTETVKQTGNQLDPFYVALSAYSRQVHMQTHEVHVWHDFGHIDTYYATRQRFFLNKRFFNAVEVDTERGVIRKTSSDAQKLTNEISWYLGLPKDLAHLAPRILDHSLDATNVFVDMEFYGYPPLAESYLHGAWDLGVWQQVMRALDKTVRGMQQHRVMEGSSVAAGRQRLLSSMYLDKTVSRTQQITDELKFFPLLDHEVVINGARCVGLAGMHSLLQAILAKSGLLHREALSVMHGDLCLSNILFDRRTSIVRLIDPRGSFGEGFSVYGDPLYDIAKLRHSFCGDYDHLVHGKFDIAMRTDGVYLQAHLTARQLALKPHVEAWIAKLAGADHLRVRLIEALLFLTMVPLHAGKPASQQAFLARGLELFTGVARHLGLWHAPRMSVAPRIEVKTMNTKIPIGSKTSMDSKTV